MNHATVGRVFPWSKKSWTAPMQEMVSDPPIHRLRDEEHHREDHHPRARLAAALGDGGDRVHADDGADEEEENVEAAKMALQLLAFGRGGDSEGVSHRGPPGLVAKALHAAFAQPHYDFRHVNDQ
jgi:hypothetical protein